VQRVLWSVAALVVLLVAAAAVLPGWIDWARYRPEIESVVSEASGLEVEIDGDIALSLLPRPSLRLQKVAFGDSAGRLLEVAQIDAELSLGSLLRGRAKVVGADLVGAVPAPDRAVAVLSTGERLAGSTLLADLKALEVRGASWPLTADRRLLLDRLSVRQSRHGDRRDYDIVYLGEATGHPLSGEAIVTGAGTCAGALSVEAAMEGLLERAAVVGHWHCTPAGPALDGKVTLGGASLQALLALLPESGGRISSPPAATMPIAARGHFDWDGTRLLLSDLSLSALHQEATVEAEYRPDGGGWLNASLLVHLLDLEGERGGQLFALAQVLLDRLAREVAEGALTISAQAWHWRNAAPGPAEAKLSLANGGLHLRAFEAALPGSGSLSWQAEQEGAPSRLELVTESLRDLLLWAGVAPSALPADRLRRMRIVGEVTPQPGGLAVESLRLQLDALSATGAGWLRFPAGESRPRLQLMLDGGVLNLDAYGLSTFADLAEAFAAAAEGTLDLRFEEAVLWDQRARGVGLRLLAHEGELRVPHLVVADLLGSRMRGEGSYRPGTRHLEATLTASGSAEALPFTLPAGLGDLWIQVVAEGAPDALAVTAEAEAAEGALFLSGLLDLQRGALGDWAVALTHPDLGRLARRLGLPFVPRDQAPSVLDLSALLQMEGEHLLQDLTGQVGPLELRTGSLRLNLAPDPPVLNLDLQAVALVLGHWAWASSQAAGTPLDWLMAESPVAVQADLSLESLVGRNWRLQTPEATLRIAPGQRRVDFRAGAGAGTLSGRIAGAGDRVEAQAQMEEVPARLLVPALPLIEVGEGTLDGDLSLEMAGRSLETALPTLRGKVTASGSVGLRLLPGLEPKAGDNALGKAVLRAVAGDAGEALARFANLTSGLGRMLGSLADRSFVLDLRLAARQGRVTVEAAQLADSQVALDAEGWADLATRTGDYAWRLVFAGQDEPYYRERRRGPLSAPDVTRDGLLFRGVSPPSNRP